MDQCADIMVLRQEGSPFGYRLSQQGFIAGISHSLAAIDDIVAGIAHSADGLRHNAGIRKHAHAIRRQW